MAFFSGSFWRAPDDTAEQILMRSTPKDVVWRKEVPLGGVITTKFNVQLSKWPKTAKNDPRKWGL